ncbi:MAG: hypothetical protein ACR2PL_10255 [Dehalococcoidia bacterium]
MLLSDSAGVPAGAVTGAVEAAGAEGAATLAGGTGDAGVGAEAAAAVPDGCAVTTDAGVDGGMVDGGDVTTAAGEGAAVAAGVDDTALAGGSSGGDMPAVAVAVAGGMAAALVAELDAPKAAGAAPTVWLGLDRGFVLWLEQPASRGEMSATAIRLNRPRDQSLPVASPNSSNRRQSGGLIYLQRLHQQVCRSRRSRYTPVAHSAGVGSIILVQARASQRRTWLPIRANS